MIEIDLTGADIEAFDRYEAIALTVLEEHGGLVLARVRDLDDLREWHLLQVPDRTAWDTFRDDPRRVEHAWLLERANVAVRRVEVRPID